MNKMLIISFISLALVMVYRTFIVVSFNYVEDLLIYAGFLCAWKIILRKKEKEVSNGSTN
jgi:hypothetical protein